jgi:tRNA A37 N6-isopentenylltransferase MiaA
VNKFNYPKVIVVAGPTASGKTSLGIELAFKFNGEIISADSRQIFKGLDVGSGKVKEEEKRGVPHHLIDILGPEEKYNVYKFQKDCLNLIQEMTSRGKLPIIVGGTGLYIESVVEQYKFSKFFKKSKKKLGLRPNTLVLNLNPNRDKTKLNIQNRLLERWNNEGMLNEVRNLINSGVSKTWLKSLGLEYKFISKFIDGEFKSEQDMLTKLNTESWHYAKRQITFIKRWEYAKEVKSKKEALNLADEFLIS